MVLNTAVSAMIILWILCIIHQFPVHGGKTAAKVGLAGVATAGGGNTGGYEGQEADFRSNGNLRRTNSTNAFKNDADRLKYDLFVARQYDRTLRPVRDPDTIVTVEMDFTIRQIMDLDEKNQVLKSYQWMRQFWTDEFLTWNETEYGGMSSLLLGSNSIWRPDIVMYEDTGLRDYSPRLPYFKVMSDGRVQALEPIAVETSCRVDILFFPFDIQRCSFTFTSWAISSDKLDIVALKDSHGMMDDIEEFFLKTGEWTIRDVTIVKTSRDYSVLTTGEQEGEQESHEEGTEEHHDDDEGILLNDTSTIRDWEMDIQGKVEELHPERLTRFHWSDIKYTFSLQRQSSLYMQSMLFPAILLTTVALLGFYLPPDSGERIGLQITILLTFMVFLLTVGEMFPASTGPFIGVYFVLCMALLGVNLFMTVLVLHLHYMPSAAVLGVNKDGRIFIKAVPTWVRILLRIAKFRFRKSSETDRTSPTTQIVFNVLDTGHLSTKIHEKSPTSSRVSFDNRGRHQNGGFGMKNDPNGSDTEKKTDTVEAENGESYIVNTKKSSFPNKLRKKQVSPTPSEQDCIRKELVGEIKVRSQIPAQEESESSRTSSVDGLGDNSDPDGISGVPTNWRSKVKSRSGGRQQRHQRAGQYQGIQRNMERINRYLKAQYDQLNDDNTGTEVENEWKAMARTIDHLCMKTYLFILFVSHVSILIAAFVSNYNFSHDDHDH